MRQGICCSQLRRFPHRSIRRKKCWAFCADVHLSSSRGDGFSDGIASLSSQACRPDNGRIPSNRVFSDLTDVPCDFTDSEAEKAKSRLAEAAADLDASEAFCRELEGKLSLLRKKSENVLGEERLKVSVLRNGNKHSFLHVCLFELA